MRNGRIPRDAAAAQVVMSGRLAVLLQARRPKSGHAVLLDRLLPGLELLLGQGITLARLFEAEETATDRGHHLRLATDHPAAGVRRRQVPKGQLRAGRADDIGLPRLFVRS